VSSLAKILLEYRERVRAPVVDHVPLVRYKYESPPGVPRLFTDTKVLIRDPGGAIDDEQADIGALNGRRGTQPAIELDIVIDT
jgi:hypothetical protein